MSQKGNKYRKVTHRDDFAQRYYCRRAREFEHKKLKIQTKQQYKTAMKKELKEELEDGEEI